MTSIGDTGLKLSPGHDDPEKALAALAKVELVITDCDGTLLYTDKSLGEPAKEAVRNLTAAGVRFTVASSRPGKGMHSIVETLGIQSPFAAFNGGKLVDPAGWKTLSAHWLSRDAAQTALESLERDGVDAWVFIDDQWYITNPGGEYVPLERRTVGYDAVVVKRFEDIDLDSIEKIVASTKDAALLDARRPSSRTRSRAAPWRCAHKPITSTSRIRSRTKARACANWRGWRALRWKTWRCWETWATTSPCSMWRVFPL